MPKQGFCAKPTQEIHESPKVTSADCVLVVTTVILMRGHHHQSDNYSNKRKVKGDENNKD